MNFKLRYTSLETNREWQLTATDDQDSSGKYRDVKGTTEFVYSHTNLDVKIPYSNPISTGEVRFGLWIEDVPFDNAHNEEIYGDLEDVSDVSLVSSCNEGSANILVAYTDIEDLKGDDDQPQNIVDSMLSMDDRRYQVSLQYKDAPGDPFTTEWRGYIVPDLTTYDEDSKPYRANFVARDFSVLSGDYAPGGASSSYQPISEVFAGILDDIGLNRPIKAVTPFTNDQLTTADCYLHQVYMSRYQLQDGTGDDDKTQISKREALERLLKNHNLILYQSDGYFWLVNMTGMANANSVFVTEYDASGTFVSDSTVDLSVTPSITTKSRVSITPALKTVKTRYQHNGTAYGFSFTDYWQTNASTDKVFTGVFISTGIQQIVIYGKVAATETSLVTNPQYEVKIQAGQYYWDGEEWTTTNSSLIRTLAYRGFPDVGAQYTYTGIFDLNTSPVPTSLSSDLLTITFFNPTHDGGDFSIANFSDFEFAITDEQEFANNYIDYRESNTGEVSVNYDIGKIYYGDRITFNSKSGLRKNSVDSFINGEWKRRGETLLSSFQRLLILDILNFYKDTKEIIQGDTFSNYLPWQTVSYDSKDFFCTSHTLNIYTGRSSVSLIETLTTTDPTDGIIEVPGRPPVFGIGTLSGTVERANYISPSGELKSDVTIESGGSSGTLSSQIQYLNNDGVLIRDETTDDANVYRPSPSSVSLSAGTYNNYSLTDGSVIFIGGSGDKILTGIVSDAGREVTIYSGQDTLTFNHQDTNSSVANRFVLPNSKDLTLKVGESVTLTHQFTQWYVKNNIQRTEVDYTGSTITPIIELAHLTNDADDYAIGDGTLFSVSLGAFYGGNDITGFAGGEDGREIEIINRGTDAIDIQHQNAGSILTNRIISPTGADIVLNQYDTVRLRYYGGTILRWVIVGGTF